jgi:hypothetical protein
MSPDNEADSPSYDDTAYRVCIDPQTNAVKVACIGLFELDTPLKGTYPTVNDLPEWVQIRLALLMMTSAVLLEARDVPGVGRRIDENIYWLYCDGRED